MFTAKGGIEFASAPDQLSGLIKIKPGGEKTAKVSLTELVCVLKEKKNSNSFILLIDDECIISSLPAICCDARES